MSWDSPLATMRLASCKLDPKVANRLLLSNGEFFDVKVRDNVWLVTTEGFKSSKPQDHLKRLTDLLSNNIQAIRAAFPDVVISFSLLVFDPEFQPEQLAKSIVASATEFGTLVIEIPPQGRELVFSGQTMLEYAA